MVVAAPEKVTYVLTDTLEDGKEYVIVNAASGDGYAVSNEASGSGSSAGLKGIAVSVSDSKVALTAEQAKKAAFTCEMQTSVSGSVSFWFNNDDDYLFADSTNGLAVSQDQLGTSPTTGYDNKTKYWHYMAKDGSADKNLLWFYRDTEDTDGYTATDENYRYYLTVSSSGVYTAEHVANSNTLKSQSTPAIYLFAKDSSEPTPHTHSYQKTGEAWADDYSSVTVTYTCSGCGDEKEITSTDVTSEKVDGGTKYTASYTDPDGKAQSVSVTVEDEEPEPTGEGVPIYRMYNTKTSEHLYTANKTEYDQCGKGNYKDWKAEGVCWYAPAKGAEGAKPVYRLYNAGLGDHHYTADEAEMKSLVNEHGWTSEGVAFYSGGEIGIYRLYNGGLKHGQHHLTADGDEVDALVSKFGWSNEGVKLHCVSLGK